MTDAPRRAGAAIAAGTTAGVHIEHALDALNFFLADVRDGLGPYLAIYLLTSRHWNEAQIGVVMSVAGIAGIVAQAPAERPSTPCLRSAC